jgi:SAM-dependent methyltransferase
MLDRLVAAATDEGIEGVETHVMDGQALDFADESFDAAASNFGVVHFRDAARGLREMCRVLRPGAEAVVTNMHEPARSELLTLIVRAVVEALPGYAPPKAPSTSRFTTVAEMTEALAQAGFDDVRVDVAMIDWVIDDAMDFFQRWGVDAPPVAYMFEGLDGRTKRAAGEAFVRLAAARSRNGVASFPTEVLIGAGRR